MKVFVDPIPRLSIAMERVALALRKTAPSGVTVVTDETQADLQVIHAVSPSQAQQSLAAPSYAMVQYGLMAESFNGRNQLIENPGKAWSGLWKGARLVWSYYAPPAWMKAHGTPVYLAPLGVDSAAFVKPDEMDRKILVVTSGYVAGPGAEPIEEVAEAAHIAGGTVAHIGPSEVENMTKRFPGWRAFQRISDFELANIYGHAKWVSGLRYVEGYELPAFEGLMCGARPVAFDMPCYRQWLDGHAAFVPELYGQELVEQLVELFKRPARPVLPDERRAVAERFNWRTIAEGFWAELLKTTGSGRMNPSHHQETSVHVMPRSGRPKVVWVGDSPTTAWTGFGRASFEILARLSKTCDVTAVGTTHDGRPYDRSVVPYDVWPLSSGVDTVVSSIRPDVVFIQHDPWLVPDFLRGCGGVPTVGVMPIDGLNTSCVAINRLAMAVWWTEFAANEARRNGYVGPQVVIPLGVDTAHFYGRDPHEARRRVLGLPAQLDDAFIVGCVARNQPRKRLDLLVRHFADWVKTRNVDDAYLYIQTAPTREAAVNVASLMEYEGLLPRLLHDERAAKSEVHESSMPFVYSALDAYFTTTQGEGFGLPVLEAMSCGVPVVAPDFAALGDWAAPAAHLVPIAEIAATLRLTMNGAQAKFGVIGGVLDRRAAVEALDRIYRDREYADTLSGRGAALARQPEFSWDVIGDRYLKVIDAVINRRAVGTVEPEPETADTTA